MTQQADPVEMIRQVYRASMERFGHPVLNWEQVEILLDRVATLQRELAEARTDVQRGYDWQRGYSDRLVEAQSKIDAQARELEAARAATEHEKEHVAFHLKSIAALRMSLADAERRLGAAREFADAYRTLGGLLDGFNFIRDLRDSNGIEVQRAIEKCRSKLKSLDALAQGEPTRDMRGLA